MNNFNISKSNVQDIFSNKSYVIPSYQRPYVWKEEQINSLLDDLIDFFEIEYKTNEQNNYFLGSIILCNVENSNDKFYLLDGQQRLTTLILIWLCLIDIIAFNFNDNEKYDALVELLKEKFAYAKEVTGDGVSTKTIPRISFQTKSFVDDQLSNLIVAATKGQLEEELHRKDIKKLIKNDETMKSIFNAVNSIKNYIKLNIEKYQEKSVFGNPQLLSKFIYRFFKTNIIFAKINTDTISDAYNLFTIINNRGVKLSNADILKTINLRYVSANDSKIVEDYAKKWEYIENNFKNRDKKDKVDFDLFLELIRAIYTKKSGSKSLYYWFEEDIFKLKSLDKESPLIKPGIDFINKMFNFFEIYKNDIDVTQVSTNNQIEYINTLKIMNNYIPDMQWKSPLLMFNEKFSDKLNENISLKTQFIKKLENYYTYFWITGLTRSKIFNKLANILNLIEQSENPVDVLNSSIWRNHYDKIVLEKTLSEDIYTKKFNNYILYRYEKILCKDQTITETTDKLTIEHIMPQTLNPEWEQIFNKESHAEYLHKIGNLTFIVRSKNSTLSNKTITEKINEIDTKYKDFMITKEFIDYVKQHSKKSDSNDETIYEWTQQNIQERGKFIIKTIIEDFNI
ncbi:DUF262 domain-containing protein [Mycoplasma buteonis]|uniref:DUF262 domain-containing protein n=1 Tax=Mycoplasma buteonis TaxID=171280 RepID=UPI00056A8252|nr:DUF262 domain-containing protein [Mycoplasma buteonis]